MALNLLVSDFVVKHVAVLLDLYPVTQYNRLILGEASSLAHFLFNLQGDY
jgi:hypothetical protein